MSGRSVLVAAVCFATVVTLAPASAMALAPSNGLPASAARASRPVPVTHLQAKVQNANEVTLSWTNPTSTGLTGVFVRVAAGQRTMTHSTGRLAAQVPRGHHSVLVTQLSAGHRYTFAVFARYNHHKWAHGALVTAVTAPGPVTDLTAAPSNSAVALSWVNPRAVDLTGVVVRRSVGSVPPASSGAGDLVAVVATPAHNYIDSTVAPDTVYSYALFAANNNGVDSRGATVRVTSPSDAPAGCTDNWTGAQSSAWATGGNWSTGAVPSSSDVACIPNDAAHLPATVSDQETVGAVNNDGGIDVEAGGNLALANGSEMSTSGGALTVGGTLTIDSSAGLHAGGPVAFGEQAQLAGPGLLATTGTTEVDALSDGVATWSDDGPTTTSADVTIEPSSKLDVEGTMTLSGAIYGSCEAVPDATPPELVISGTIDSVGDTVIGNQPGPGWYDCLTVPVGGTLDITSGTLSLQQGGPGTFMSGSTLDVARTATLNVVDARVDAGANLVAPGTVDVEGTFDLDAQATIATLDLGDATQPGFGVLEGTASVVITKTLDADRARLGIDGTLTVSPSATALLSMLVMEASGDDATASPTLLNQGTVTVPVSGNVAVNSATFTNAATVNLDAGSDIDGSCDTVVGGQRLASTVINNGSIIADGTFDDPATIGTPPGYSPTCVTVTDNGTIRINAGVLQAGGSFEFADGSFTAVPQNSSELELTDDATVDPGSVIGSGLVSLDGDLTLDEPLSVDHLDFLSGELFGPDSLTVTTSLTATGGEIEPGGNLTLAARASATINSLFVSGEFDNAGTVTIPASIPDGTSNSIYVRRVGEMRNAGELDIGSYAVITGDCADAGVGPGLLTNTGKIVSNGRSGTESGIGTGAPLPDQDSSLGPACLQLIDEGALTVPAGTLDLDGAGTTIEPDATVTVNQDATLAVIGQVAIDAGAAVSVAGELAVDETPTGGLSTLTLDADVTLPDLSLDLGGIDGTGAITLTGDSSANYGTLATTGGTTIEDGVDLTVERELTIDSALTNNGLISMPAPGGDGALLDISPGATLTNNGAMSIASGVVTGGCPEDSMSGGELTSSGSITTSGQTEIDMGGQPAPSCLATLVTGIVNLSGDLNVHSIDLGAGASVTDPASSTLELGEATVAPGATISGDGYLAVIDHVVVDGDHTLPAIDTAGKLEIGPAATVTTRAFRPESGGLQVDSADGGPWGQLVTSGNVDPTFDPLTLDATNYTPACGTTVTALTATAVADTFNGASGTTPTGGTWKATSTGTTAGATLTC